MQRIKSGEASKYGESFSKSGVLVVSAQSPGIKTEQLENLNFMEKSFPVISLSPEHKRTLNTFTQDFAKNQFKKHNKAVSKRK